MEHVGETTVVKSIKRYLSALPECFFWKEHGGMYGTAGIPDIIACVDGRFIAFEVKTETGRLTKLQEVTLGRIRDAGGRAYMVRSTAEVAGILKEIEVAG